MSMSLSFIMKIINLLQVLHGNEICEIYQWIMLQINERMTIQMMDDVDSVKQELDIYD